MNISNCLSCGEYKYIDKNGYCRSCLGFEEDSNLFDDIETPCGLGKETIKQWFSDPDISEGYEIVNRYWIDQPYCVANIAYRGRTDDHEYVVSKPELKSDASRLFNIATENVDLDSIFDCIEDRESSIIQLGVSLGETTDEYEFDPDTEILQKVWYHLREEESEYGELNPLIRDSDVERISCNCYDNSVHIDHSDYDNTVTNIEMKYSEVDKFIKEIAEANNEEFSETSPVLDTSLSNVGSMYATLGCETTDCDSTFSIDKSPTTPTTPIDLLDSGTFSSRQLAYLWLAVEHNRDIMFVGSVSSGKTSSLNAVSMFIPPKSKIISVEERREISLSQENWIPTSTSQTEDDVSVENLMSFATKLRPEYIILSELRGSESNHSFQAMSTGHTVLTTMCAESAESAVTRLTSDPLNIPEQLFQDLDIICVQERSKTDKSSIRNKEIREIGGLNESGTLTGYPVFERDKDNSSFVEYLDQSGVLKETSRSRNKENSSLNEINRRQEVLEYMRDENIEDPTRIAQIIQEYIINPNTTINEIRDGKITEQT